MLKVESLSLDFAKCVELNHSKWHILKNKPLIPSGTKVGVHARREGESAQHVHNVYLTQIKWRNRQNREWAAETMKREEGKKRTDRCVLKLRAAAMSTTNNNTIHYPASGEVDRGAAHTLTSGARPQALCSVMGGPALCTALVRWVPTQHVWICEPASACVRLRP